MPDSKSGIRHLSNVATMHHNMLQSLQRVYSNQFKSVMKAYSKEINHIKDDLAKLEKDRERYVVIKDSSSKHNETSNTAEVMTLARRRAFELSKQRNKEHNRLVEEKVHSFLKEDQSNRNTTARSYEQAAGDKSLPKAGRTTPTFTNNPSLLLNQPAHNGSAAKGSRRNLWRSYSTVSSYTTAVDTTLQSFQNDRFVNSTINNARAKLAALHNSKSASSLYASKSAPSTTWTAERRQRSQSAAANTRSMASVNEQKRFSKSADVKARTNATRRAENLQQNKPPIEFYMGHNQRVEEGGQSRRSRRQANELRNELNERYIKFEEALQRRMMIREMKAAEYDVNHGKVAGSTLQDLLPTKNTAMATALRRQSALMALERSFLGPPTLKAAK